MSLLETKTFVDEEWSLLEIKIVYYLMLKNCKETLLLHNKP